MHLHLQASPTKVGSPSVGCASGRQITANAPDPVSMINEQRNEDGQGVRPHQIVRPLRVSDCEIGNLHETACARNILHRTTIAMIKVLLYRHRLAASDRNAFFQDFAPAELPRKCREYQNLLRHRRLRVEISPSPWRWVALIGSKVKQHYSHLELSSLDARILESTRMNISEKSTGILTQESQRVSEQGQVL